MNPYESPGRPARPHWHDQWDAVRDSPERVKLYIEYLNNGADFADMLLQIGAVIIMSQFLAIAYLTWRLFT